MSSANFLHLDRAIMRSHNSYMAASCGCSTSHRMIIYFLWASVWSESNLLSLCGRNDQRFFCFYFVLTLRQSRESEEGSRSSYTFIQISFAKNKINNGSLSLIWKTEDWFSPVIRLEMGSILQHFIRSSFTQTSLICFRCLTLRAWVC